MQFPSSEGTWFIAPIISCQQARGNCPIQAELGSKFNPINCAVLGLSNIQGYLSEWKLRVQTHHVQFSPALPMWWFRLRNAIALSRTENDSLRPASRANKYLGIVPFKINPLNFWINAKLMNRINFWMWSSRLSCTSSMGFKGWWRMTYRAATNGAAWECELPRDLALHRKCECGDRGAWREGPEDRRNGTARPPTAEPKFRHSYVKKLLMKISKKYFKFVLKKHM